VSIDFTQKAPSASDGGGSGPQRKTEDAAGQLQDRAQEAAGQAQEKAQQAASQAQDKLREQIDQRSAQAAEQINAQASDLRSVSEALRNEGKAGPADAADRLATYAEKVGGYLHEKDSNALLADAEDFGRQRPWAAAAAGLAVGFAASRFLKASSRQRYQTRDSDSGRAPGNNGRGHVPPVSFTGEAPALAGSVPPVPDHTPSPTPPHSAPGI
jgi:ElaB/YqjD/DUF883 family membrane-anchored ribosome-binding protein